MSQGEFSCVHPFVYSFISLPICSYAPTVCVSVLLILDGIVCRQFVNCLLNVHKLNLKCKATLRCGFISKAFWSVVLCRQIELHLTEEMRCDVILALQTCLRRAVTAFSGKHLVKIYPKISGFKLDVLPALGFQGSSWHSGASSLCTFQFVVTV